MKQPSPAITYVRWSHTSLPNVVRSQRSAIAMPTASPTPWPSGPVVTSIPAVWPASGCPGVRLPHWRNWRMSSSERSYPVRWSMAYCRMQACPLESTKRS